MSIMTYMFFERLMTESLSQQEEIEELWALWALAQKDDE